MSDMETPPSTERDDMAQAERERGRQFDDHNDLSNADPDSPENEERTDRQYDQNQGDLLLPGIEPGGMEISGGNEPDSDDGGLSGIRPEQDEELDNSGKISRSSMGGL